MPDDNNAGPFASAPTVRTLIDEINSRTAYRLAADADVTGPDSPTSAGSEFLDTVRAATIEAFTYEYADQSPADVTAENIRDWVSDAYHEIADGCVPIYTGELWRTFYDLAAWEEDDEARELYGEDSDMNDRAGICLYVIARRMALELIGELAEAWEEDADAITDQDDDNDDDDDDSPTSAGSEYDGRGYYLDRGADTNDEFPTRCTLCGRPVQSLSGFPGGLCIDCWSKSESRGG